MSMHGTLVERTYFTALRSCIGVSTFSGFYGGYWLANAGNDLPARSPVFAGFCLVGLCEWAIRIFCRRFSLGHTTIFRTGAYCTSAIALCFGYWIHIRFSASNYPESLIAFFLFVAGVLFTIDQGEKTIRARLRTKPFEE